MEHKHVTFNSILTNCTALIHLVHAESIHSSALQTGIATARCGACIGPYRRTSIHVATEALNSILHSGKAMSKSLTVLHTVPRGHRLPVAPEVARVIPKHTAGYVILEATSILQSKTGCNWRLRWLWACCWLDCSYRDEHRTTSGGSRNATCNWRTSWRTVGSCCRCGRGCWRS